MWEISFLAFTSRYLFLRFASTVISVFRIIYLHISSSYMEPHFSDATITPYEKYPENYFSYFSPKIYVVGTH